MRAFIVTCLLATALAAPQGYNYQQQNNRFQLPGLPQINAVSASGPSNIPEGQSFLQQALHTPKVQQTFLGGSSLSGYNTAPQQQQQQQQQFIPQQNFGLNVLPQNFGPQQQQQQFLPQQQVPAGPPVVTKDIYVHVAPEEQEERFVQPQLPVPPPRKHYRIVFIKAPSPNVNKAALRVQQAPSEEKTIIYVLTKKPDPLDLQAAIEEAPKTPSKPEVYFIKYKTQEEAQHAQRAIQAQYDQLGGTTQVSDEGVAPVTSVIGALDQANSFASTSSSSSSSSSGFNTNSITGQVNAGLSKYLPPIVRHK